MPAYNEAALIKRTLAPLSRAAVDGYIELIVVCNGCIDDTADLARIVPGARVLELAQASKPAALNAGDDAATLWPRLYLDADIQISAEAALATLDRLAHGDVLVARPDRRYDVSGASALVRGFLRAESRIPQHKLAMWGAGAYGLSAKGHERLGAFPAVTADDFYVDTLFNADEKAVVSTDPVVVKMPADAKNLLATLRRNRRASAELLADRRGVGARMHNTSLDTAVTVLRSIRGPRSAADAAVFLGMKMAARFRYRKSQVWERDESSRSGK
jgi:glycosyltransferase involved in cell wall biosynthesis